MDYSWYSRLLARRYWLIIAVVFFFSLSCIVASLVIFKPPDFKDPQAGFEARGTELAQRLKAWANLRDATGQLTNNPLEYYYYSHPVTPVTEIPVHKNKIKHQKDKSKKKKKKQHKKKHRVHNEFADEDEQHLDVRRKRSSENPKNSSVCDFPLPAYSRVVVASSDEQQDLWSVPGMLALCHIDEMLRSSPHFTSVCEGTQGKRRKGKCCPTWSPANYVAHLSKRASCRDISQEDLASARKLLLMCYPLYLKGDLSPDCDEDLTCKLRVPAACYRHGNAVYQMLHYVLDTSFFPKDENDTDTRLTSAMLMLPLAKGTAAESYYENLDHELVHGEFQVVAMDFGIKNEVFDKTLISDTYYMLFGFAFVTLCIWVYTGSCIITLATVLVVLFSLGISFAFYKLVLRIELFPFMNLLAAVVAVGIGSDDAFIFCKVWERAKREGPVRADESLLRLTHETLRHAVPAMFVSTLTTAVAFFASIVSNVTAINCFSIFSGTTVIVNFLLMITWLPACVLAAERLRCERPLLLPLRVKLLEPLGLLVDRLSRLFVEAVARLVVSLRWLWLLLFSAIGVAACVVVFYVPGLQLPNSPGFQLLYAGHPFERYEQTYAQRFHFEQAITYAREHVFTLRFIWGVLPVDNGDHFNPASRGSLVYDPSFNITAADSQEWLFNFCEQLRLQPFYRSTLGPLLPNCFIATLRTWMERPCQDPGSPEINRSPCCSDSAFPFEPEILRYCAAEALAEMYRTPKELWSYISASQITAGLRYQRLNNSDEKVLSEIRALVVEYDSNVTFSFSHAEAEQLYRTVDAWTRRQMESAPPGLRNGWFVSEFEFYELQRTLYEGTLWSVVVSMGLAFTVLGLVTLDPLVSLFAILAVAAAIVVTVAVLVLLGWHLNVLENVAVSTAIGLTVDFTLHYGVCYRGSGARHRASRVKDALDRMAGPTLMAALTTAAAGALVLPSQVLAYIQIGIFLVIVMTVSWLYATFWLCPMLATAGPTKRFRMNILNRRREQQMQDIEEHEQEQIPMNDISPASAE